MMNQINLLIDDFSINILFLFERRRQENAVYNNCVLSAFIFFLCVCEENLFFFFLLIISIGFSHQKIKEIYLLKTLFSFFSILKIPLIAYITSIYSVVVRTLRWVKIRIIFLLIVLYYPYIV